MSEETKVLATVEDKKAFALALKAKVDEINEFVKQAKGLGIEAYFTGSGSDEVGLEVREITYYYSSFKLRL